MKKWSLRLWKQQQSITSGQSISTSKKVTTKLEMFQLIQRASMLKYITEKKIPGPNTALENEDVWELQHLPSCVNSSSSCVTFSYYKLNLIYSIFLCNSTTAGNGDDYDAKKDSTLTFRPHDSVNFFGRQIKKPIFMQIFPVLKVCFVPPNSYFKIPCDATQQLCPVCFRRPRLGARHSTAHIAWG